MSSFFQWDGDFLLWVQEHLRFDGLTPFMKAVTVLGNAGVFWLALTFLMFFIPKTRRAALASTLGIVFVYITCNLITKNLVNRIRPYEVVEGLERLVAKPTDASFPSGHTAISFGSAVALFFYLDRRLGIGLLSLAAMIAWSRLYVGVHYPTDVLGGLVFGVTMGILGHLAADRLWPVLVNKFGKSPDTAQQANEDVGTDPADRSDMA